MHLAITTNQQKATTNHPTTILFRMFRFVFLLGLVAAQDCDVAGLQNCTSYVSNYSITTNNNSCLTWLNLTETCYSTYGCPPDANYPSNSSCANLTCSDQKIADSAACQKSLGLNVSTTRAGCLNFWNASRNCWASCWTDPSYTSNVSSVLATGESSCPAVDVTLAPTPPTPYSGSAQLSVVAVLFGALVSSVIF